PSPAVGTFADRHDAAVHRRDRGGRACDGTRCGIRSPWCTSVAGFDDARIGCCSCAAIAGVEAAGIEPACCSPPTPCDAPFASAKGAVSGVARAGLPRGRLVGGPARTSDPRWVTLRDDLHITVDPTPGSQPGPS